jgi:hypothetical protein
MQWSNLALFLTVELPAKLSASDMRIKMKLRTLGLMSVGLLLSQVALNANAIAHATSKFSTFEVKITQGDLLSNKVFSGKIVYDDDFLTDTGFEILSLGSGLESVTFDYVGSDLTTPVSYTASDDVGSPRFPQVGFSKGTLEGLLDGLLYEVEISPTLFFFFDGKFFGTDETSTGKFNNGTVTYAPPLSVPDPSSVIGFALLGFFGVLNLSRRKLQ